MDWRGFRRNGVGFACALVVGVLLGSVVQTQFNLWSLQQLGVDIGLGTRLSTTLQDLVHFAPLYAVLFGVSFLFSTLITGALLTWLGLGARAVFHALGAAAGLWLTFFVVDRLAPMPTLIAATRSPEGLMAMLLAAAGAGCWFARLTRRRERPRGGYSAGPALMLAVAAGIAAPAPEARAQASVPYDVQVVSAGLEHPWSLAFLPDGGALITERAGRLRRLTENGELAPEPVSGVPAVFSSGQAGLFDVLVSPDFAESGRVYLSYACGSQTANHLCVARGQLVGQRLDNVTEIFRAMPAKRGNAHYGGRMAWLPDGSLIVALGDGFDYREQAQRLSSHLGSIVRLSADGSAPPDNPFVGTPGARPEVYSYGHRNIQGLLFDPVEQLLISHEHGPRGGDEINLIQPGRNYGWPIISYGLDYTGAMVTPFTEREGMVQPLLHWTPSIAPSGMTRYRGTLFSPWQGNLLVGALAGRSVHRVELVDGRARDVETLFEELGARIRDVITGPDGALYLLTDSADGRILKVTPRR